MHASAYMTAIVLMFLGAPFPLVSSYLALNQSFSVLIEYAEASLVGASAACYQETVSPSDYQVASK